MSLRVVFQEKSSKKGLAIHRDCHSPEISTPITCAWVARFLLRKVFSNLVFTESFRGPGFLLQSGVAIQPHVQRMRHFHFHRCFPDLYCCPLWLYNPKRCRRLSSNFCYRLFLRHDQFPVQSMLASNCPVAIIRVIEYHIYSNLSSGVTPLA